MAAWIGIALTYTWYLAAVAWTVPRFARARIGSAAAAGSATVAALMIAPRLDALPAVLYALAPMPVLLAGYWMSGLFLLHPMPALERRLLRLDHRVLTRLGLAAWYGRRPLARALLELAYLMVYVVVPAGALAVVLSGRPADIDRFWAVVLLSAFTCYGTLPWVQTRPPRALERPGAPSSPLRSLNLAILGGASIHANTLPSGHAATAAAVGLAVSLTSPFAGAVLLALAAAISVATVSGRYHFVLDTVLGLAVAAGAFVLVTLWERATA